MGKANRSTLKNYFKKGHMPSGQQFADLIDSMLNMVDEGFDKSPADGLKVSQLGENTALMSFYHHTDLNRPIWTLTCNRDNGRLIIKNGSGQPSMVLSADGHVGIGQSMPQYPLDVAGVIAAQGRTGGIKGLAPADGQWHPIVENLTGCQALEIMAGVGKPKTGRYALVRATALNTFHPKGIFMNFLNLKRRIHCQHAYYRSRCDRILLRWQGSGGTYALALKTKGAYPDGIQVQYNVTRLWFDKTMAGSFTLQEDAAETTDPAK
ncbi:MAG: hypothetical protein HKP58_04360 [Desulfatitalea sp.]|nr:hypothetical protein [Desulfatitalea sp.]NNJ99624.1 hypothetical protein [Desulfatitalea sp.]